MPCHKRDEVLIDLNGVELGGQCVDQLSKLYTSHVQNFSEWPWRQHKADGS